MAIFKLNLLQNSELVAFKFVKSFQMTQDESQNHQNTLDGDED